MDKYIGRLLDNRYEILEVIGTGGMAVVYKARCHRLNRFVAIKILKDDFLEDEDFRSRFHAESQAVAMLSHPNIVSVYDVSTSVSMEADYIVMELIEGITLKQYMEKKGVLNWKETLHFAMQIGKALEHAHSRGVVHRDIKPHNVMVLKNGSVKVADFGIARMMSEGNTLTKEALGSVHYISPEQAKGGRVDNRSDIYSLGVVMYEMMAGRPPYEGESPVAVAIQHINGGAALPSSLNPNIPRGLEQIIMKAMAYDMGQRYVSATQMLSDMEEFRKDPMILFDYNAPNVDSVIKNRKPPLVLEPNAPQRPVRRENTGSKKVPNVRNTEPQQRKSRPAPSRGEDDRRSRAATIAMIICSIVIVVALGVFLLVILNGGLQGGIQQKVDVPRLVGKDFGKLPKYDGITVEIEEYRFSETYEANRIIEQSILAGTRVDMGTVVEVVVSKGAEPVLMPNLIRSDKSRAESELDNLQMNLTIKWEEEYHPDIAKGVVIRTAPLAGEELDFNQEITLVVSLGAKAEPQVVGMPKLTGKTLSAALDLLKEKGMPTPVIEMVYSDKPENTVVSQSHQANTVVMDDTIVTIQVSKGPAPTEPPTPAPTQPPTNPPTDPPTQAPTPAPDNSETTE